MNIALTGGGTGGHVIPCLALVPRLEKYFDSIIYIGSESGIEREPAGKYSIPYYPVPTAKFDRSRLLSDLKIPFRLHKGISCAKKVLKETRTDVVFAKGGFVSLPAAFAARSLRIPVVCHESDCSLGLANRLISRFAAKTLVSDERTAARSRIVTGSPVREEIFSADPERARSLCGFAEGKKILLVVGGSSGAKVLDEAVIASLDRLLPDYDVIHISPYAAPARAGYFPMRFTDAIYDLYALADAVISRCGANAAAELTAMGKRTLFVPLPKGASRGDQLQNACRLASEGKAEVLAQESLSPDTLAAGIKKLFRSPPPPPDMSALAKINENIACILRDTASDYKARGAFGR